MADSTLAAIRTKVRRLTRSPSIQQITNAQIDEYVNTFIQYDFPEHLRLNFLRRKLSFFTQPNVDLYETNTTNAQDPLFNFNNRYITVHPPIFIDGYEAMFTQSQEEFFNQYPFVSSINTVATGDGGTTNFTGTLTNFPVLPNEVLFSAIDANNNGLRLSDDGAGNLVGDTGGGPNTIDYVTGAFELSFSAGPAIDNAIESHVVPYEAARPDTVLYFNTGFKVRPVPDKVYKIQLEVYERPTELLASGSSPELEQWWQYIAYGASKKIFEDRTDMDSVQNIMPEYRRQELLVNRRTVVQQTSNRVSTIFTDQTDISGGPWGNRGRF